MSSSVGIAFSSLDDPAFFSLKHDDVGHADVSLFPNLYVECCSFGCKKPLLLDVLD
jgi:hypothetical protein